MAHYRAERAASRALRFGNLEADKQPEKQTTEKGRVAAAEIPSTSKQTPTPKVEEEQLESGAEKEDASVGSEEATQSGYVLFMNSLNFDLNKSILKI